jgi:hypothetical protein
MPILTLLLIGVLMFPLVSTVEAALWSRDARITAITVEDGNVFLEFTVSPFTHRCSVTDGRYMLGGTSASVDKMTSLATQALMSSRSVQVYLSDGGCSSEKAPSFPVLTALKLK